MNLRYFSIDEFRCKCGCGRADMDPEFLRMLDDLRHELGFPLVVTSGFRCSLHNQRVSSTGPNGPHCTGRAVDLNVRGERAYSLLALAPRRGFTGIGVQQKGASRFVHLDNLTAPAFPRPTVWTY